MNVLIVVYNNYFCLYLNLFNLYSGIVSIPSIQVDCKICGKTLSESNMRKHISRVHEKNRPHPCPVCDSKFFRKSEVLQHVNIHHADSEKRTCWICNDCGRNYSSKQTRREHVLRGHCHGPREPEEIETVVKSEVEEFDSDSE